jgi:hypothetical protein
MLEKSSTITKAAWLPTAHNIPAQKAAKRVPLRTNENERFLPNRNHETKNNKFIISIQTNRRQHTIPLGRN